MNVQPFYQLKERLEYAAIAGTRLLAEDFRLRKALEAMEPLSRANPVFAKIHTNVQALLSAPEDGQPGLLLDVLGLVHAVAYAQGRTGLAGTLVPQAVGIGRYLPIPFGVLNPLLEDLRSTGGGRFDRI